MASLTIQSDSGEENYSLESPSVTLGRGLECDVRLKDIKSSRRHCQVVRVAQGYKLVDLGSGNGTYINGVLMTGEHQLHHGDSIQIGECVILFKDGSAVKGPTVMKSPGDTQRRQVGAATSRVPTADRPTTRTEGPPTAATKKGAPSATTVTKKTEAAPPPPCERRRAGYRPPRESRPLDAGPPPVSRRARRNRRRPNARPPAPPWWNASPRK